MKKTFIATPTKADFAKAVNSTGNYADVSLWEDYGNLTCVYLYPDFPDHWEYGNINTARISSAIEVDIDGQFLKSKLTPILLSCDKDVENDEYAAKIITSHRILIYNAKSPVLPMVNIRVGNFGLTIEQANILLKQFGFYIESEVD